MATPINTIKAWFKTHLIPTQTQFYAMFDSYWHKSEKLSVGDVQNLGNYLDSKIDKIEGKGLSTNNYTNEEKQLVTKLADRIRIVGGNSFEYIPVNGNDGAAFVQGDIAINGRGPAGDFIKRMTYLSGDGSQFAAWKVNESV